MDKKVLLQHNGMVQDIAQSKNNSKYYFEGRNIKIVTTDDHTTEAVSNNKGNKSLLTIPTPIINFNDKTITYNSKVLDYVTDEINELYSSTVNFGEQIIVGNCKVKNGFIIASTNNNGYDCIWFLDENTTDLTLLYLRDLNFSTENPLQILNNYENSKINKIYIADGVNQVKFLNIYHSEDNDDNENLIDLNSVSLNAISDVDFVNPVIDEISYGGTHTSGMIQYAYSYYKINGSQSALSPLSEIIPLGKSVVEGGNVNEVVGTIPKIVINPLDNRFTNIRLYSVKYTSFKELPTVSLIADRNIDNFSSFTYYDDGKIIQNITLEEFIFLNGNFIIPKHIESKDNRLFYFNYRNKIYNLSLKENNIDFRAYSFPLNSTNVDVFKTITDYDENTQTPSGLVTKVNINHINAVDFLEEDNASINGYYHINKYQYNSNILGGEGPFLKYEIIRTTDNKNEIYDYRFLKDNELYRIGIQLYNKYGLKSTPKWISDFVVTSDNNDNNLNGNYAGLKITFKPEFYVWLNTQSNFLNENGDYDEYLKPVGFKLLRADRTISDRTIVGQGLINGMVSQSMETSDAPRNVTINRVNEGLKMPSFMRRFDDYLCPMFANESYVKIDDRRNHPQWIGFNSGASREIYASSDRRNSVYQFNQLMQFYSPEIIFNMLNNIESNKLKVIGSLDNIFNGLKTRSEEWGTGTFDGFTIYQNVLSPYDVKSNSGVGGYGGNHEACRRGMIGPTWIHQDYERKRTQTYQYIRDYSGTFRKNTNDDLYLVYGKPEIAEFGQNSKKYNNDNDLIYTNSLTPMISDVAGRNDSKLDNTEIRSVLSHGVRSAVFALGKDIETFNRPNIENLFENSSMYGNIPGDIGGIANTIKLDDVVSTYNDLLTLNFTSQFIGVLETGNVYYNNDVDFIYLTYDFLNVVYKFNSLAEYDSAATAPGVTDWTGIRITIVDGVDNKIYEVVDQNTSLAGLNDTGEVFNFLEDTPSTVDFIVTVYNDLFTLSTSDTLADGYTVLVSSTGDVYIWNEDDQEWIFDSKLTTGDLFTGGVGLICEFINDEKLKYVGNYYGGNSYESKLKTVYVEASKYFSFNTLVPLLDNSFSIVDPGDTFIQEYQFARLSKSDRNPDSSSYIRITELVKVRLESIVNQNKRNDESKNLWSEGFSPSQGDYHSYNRVYSQTSDLIKSQNLSYEIKTNEDYDTAIISSHLKRPGEIIDNWTNLSMNDYLYLDGKYGSINSVIKQNDEIVTFQDSAIAKIIINPRVQVQGNDNIGIELGTGNVLHDFQYLTTISGTLNKFGTINSNTGIYYYDTINNGLFNINNNTNKLSDIKGIHTYFQNNINPNIIKKDNHILKEGVQFGYDYLNNEIFFTFHQLDKSDTINFSEFRNEFISFHDFNPSFYFINGNTFITSNPDNKKLYSHEEGVYNIYYDEYKPSYITYNINPEPHSDCILNNINFKSELYLNNIDIPDKTITEIQSFNDYQSTLLTPLINHRNGNLRRRFRDWNAEIPRDGRERIRGPWSKVKLQFNNQSNYKLILHDMIISYSV